MMWYGEMVSRLQRINRDMDNMDIGMARTRLAELITELKTNGIVINAKIEE